MSLPLPAPFSPELVLAHLGQSSFGAVWRVEGRVAARLLRGPGGGLAPVRFDFSQPGCLVVFGPGWAVEAARRIFSLDHDLAQADQGLARDPHLAPLVDRYRGLRLVRAPDLYEALVTAILGQQVSVAVAQAQRRRLIAALGELMDGLGTYPAPHRLLEAGPEALQALGISRQKARYLVAVASWAAGWRLAEEAFAPLGDGEAAARLMEIPGVGRWTAEVALMRGLGRVDALPASDVGLWNAAQRVLALASRPSEKEMRGLAERWRPWRSYAALYLWTALADGRDGSGYA